MYTAGSGREGFRQRIGAWADTHRPLTAALFAAAVMAGLFLFLYYQTLIGEFNVDFVRENFHFFLNAIGTTLWLTVASYVLGLGLGFAVASARVSQNRILKGVAKGYVDTFRGTPILVQILFWCLIILTLTPGYRQQALLAAVIALTINTGAYQAEIFRGGFKAIQPGQIEAAHAVGFTAWQTMRHIKLPQTLRLIIPPMTNEFIALLKASALLSLCGVVELSFVAGQLAVRFFMPIEPWTVATLLYLSMTVPLAKFVQFLETKFRIPGLGLPAAESLYRPQRPRKSPGLTPAETRGLLIGWRPNALYAALRKRLLASRPRDEAVRTRDDLRIERSTRLIHRNGEPGT